ncbi:hypothetical protein KJ656_17115, partial [bacterium]|nr:hypothetical protein [bacterium]
GKLKVRGAFKTDILVYTMAISIDIFRVSKLMGHSSVLVTQKHYAELLDKNLASSVKMLETVIK